MEDRAGLSKISSKQGAPIFLSSAGLIEGPSSLLSPLAQVVLGRGEQLGLECHSGASIDAWWLVALDP